MPARILDGLKIRDEIFSELNSDIAKLHAQGIRPGLALPLLSIIFCRRVFMAQHMMGNLMSKNKTKGSLEQFHFFLVHLWISYERS